MRIIDGVKYETICYVFKEDNVLLIERVKPGKIMYGCYVNPGGGLEEKDGGDFATCAKRELNEETGILAQKVIAIGEILFDNSVRDFGKGIGAEPNHKVYFFEATKYNGEIIETEEGRPVFVKWSEIEKLKMPAGDRVFHKWVMERKGRYFEGQVRNTQDGVDWNETWVNYH